MRGVTITREIHVKNPYKIYFKMTTIISPITYIMTSMRYTKREAPIPGAKMCRQKKKTYKHGPYIF